MTALTLKRQRVETFHPHTYESNLQTIHPAKSPYTKEVASERAFKLTKVRKMTLGDENKHKQATENTVVKASIRKQCESVTERQQQHTRETSQATKTSETGTVAGKSRVHSLLGYYPKGLFAHIEARNQVTQPLVKAVREARRGVQAMRTARAENTHTRERNGSVGKSVITRELIVKTIEQVPFLTGEQKRLIIGRITSSARQLTTEQQQQQYEKIYEYLKMEQSKLKQTSSKSVV